VSRYRSALRTHRRPMAGWWRRDRRFALYALREASSLAVLGWALWWLWGLWQLGQGPEAFARWLAGLQHPVSLALHGVTLLALLLHSVTWFQAMPKTMPPLPLPARAVTAAGLVAMGAVSAALLAWLGWGGR
jgi:fumarate reductase subunit C